jgi:hypothetical protein
MEHKKLILPTSIFMITSWTCLILVVLRLEPCLQYSLESFCQKTSSLAMILFYASFALAISSTFTLLGYIARIYLNNNEVFASHFNLALRQGLILSGCIITCIMLLTANILQWWTTLIVFGLAVLIELYFLNREYEQ